MKQKAGQGTIQDENVKYSELNEGEITTYKSRWNAAYVMFGNFYILKHFHQKRRNAGNELGKTLP